MSAKRAALLGGVGLVLAGLLAVAYGVTAPSTGAGVAIDADDIGGVVLNPSGKPEAGVWVIAETHDLAVRYAKIVVTDDQGRYVIPDLPQANYDVWVRGYGLVDSPRLVTTPGKSVDLPAVPAPDAAAAAQYYPSIYWFAMLKTPDEGDFSGPNRDESMPENIKSHTAWLNIIKTTGW